MIEEKSFNTETVIPGTLMLHHEARKDSFDYCTYAYLCDVYVYEDYRERGLSSWMMSCIMKHPDLSSLRRFTLATKDAHFLYEKFGFKGLSQEENRRFMSILKDNI